MSAKLAAKYHVTMHTLREQREAGATGLEYAGMIAVAALVVALVWGAIKGAGVDTSISTAITKLFNPGGGGEGN